MTWVTLSVLVESGEKIISLTCDRTSVQEKPGVSIFVTSQKKRELFDQLNRGTWT